MILLLVDALVGHVQRAAEPRGRVEQHGMKAAFLQDHGGRDSRGAAAHHRHRAPGAVADRVGELALAAGGRVDRALDVPAVLDLVEAHEAADALADGLRLAGLRLVAPLRVGEMPARDAHQVAAALRQDRLRDLRLLDVRYRDDRYLHVLLDLGRHVFFPSLLDRARLDAGGELGAVRESCS